MSTQSEQQTIPPSADAGATQTTAAAAVPSSFSATPPPSGQASPPEQTQAEKQARMDAIVARMAGKEEPTKPKEAAEPPKPKEAAEPPKPAEPPRKGAGALRQQLKSERLKLAELAGKYAELAAKQQDGKATELEEYKMEEMQRQYNEIVAAQEQEYMDRAAEVLGDRYEAFAQNSQFYAPLLNQHAGKFAMAATELENGIEVLADFYEAFNNGSIDFSVFVKLPEPRQLFILRQAAEFKRNPQAAAAEAQRQTQQQAQARQAQPPPKVPVPSDSAVGSQPVDKNARMAAIVARMAGTV